MLEIGPKELLTLGVLVSSIAGSAAVVKQSLKQHSEKINQLAKQLTTIHSRLDSEENKSSVSEHRLNILAEILNPNNLEKHAIKIAKLEEQVLALAKAADQQYKLHNGQHPGHRGS